MDDELERINEVVSKLSLPEYVREVKYRLDEDWTDDPAVYICVIMGDEEAVSERFPGDVSEISRSIAQAVFATRVNRWPYVRFRSESEERGKRALKWLYGLP